MVDGMVRALKLSGIDQDMEEAIQAVLEVLGKGMSSAAHL